jgi:hypothetical protein
MNLINLTNPITLTFTILFFLALYDFIIWYGVFHEQRGGNEWIFRLIKFIIDYPLTILFTFYVLHFTFTDLMLLYFLKLSGFCDMIYICIWWLIKNKPYEETPDWLWWSFPLGWLATILNLVSLLRGEIRGGWKGEIYFSHFKIQVASALLIYLLIKIVIPA